VWQLGWLWFYSVIGLVLTAGGLVALACQIPSDALIDEVRAHRLIGGVAIAAICASALSLALRPTFPIVVACRILHAGASALLGPVIAAISLGLVGHAALGERLGRNARYASIGSGLAAAGMGAFGQLFSSQAVFFLTAAMILPALLALHRIRAHGVERPVRRKDMRTSVAGVSVSSFRRVVCDQRLVIFASCIVLFHLANAAMLPLMGSVLAMRSSQWAVAVTAACMVVPQLVVAGASPWVGRKTQIWGRRPLLMLCFVALAIRGALFGLTTASSVVVASQVLDGISAATLGVLFPLIVADITRATGRFNLSLGLAGTAVGIGASLSTTLAGYMLDHFGSTATFLGLACVALSGLTLVFLLMPETRPEDG
jgi:MFS family permease